MAFTPKGYAVNAKLAVVFMILHYLSRTEYAAAELRIEPSGVQILKPGDNFTFKCTAPGESTHIVNDEHYFVPTALQGGITNSEFNTIDGSTSNTKILKIVGMDIKRIGRYSCDVSATGESVSLVLLTPMAFTNPNGVKVVKPGDSVLLSCDAGNYPPLQATFERDTSWTPFWGALPGQRQTPRPRFSFDSVKEKLVIHTSLEILIPSAAHQDMGRYVCKDSFDKNNYASDYVDLLVLEARCSDDEYPAVGETATLSCWVQEVAQNAQRVAWYQNSILLNGEDRTPGIIVSPTGQSLIILNATESNSGTYRCDVSITLNEEDYHATPKEIYVGGNFIITWMYVMPLLLMARFM
ncbi:vascular endothelial growth factor receptor 1-like isoform X2 [Glandiceps talaboti]